MQVQHQPIRPNYSDDLTRSIGALQYLQTLVTVQNDPTLSDITNFVQAMQHEFGSDASLEDVIQTLVARHLTVQLAQRRSKVVVVEVQL